MPISNLVSPPKSGFCVFNLIKGRVILVVYEDHKVDEDLELEDSGGIGAGSATIERTSATTGAGTSGTNPASIIVCCAIENRSIESE